MDTEVNSLPVEESPQILTVPLVATLLAKNYRPAKIAKVFNKSRPAVTQFIKRHKNELEALKDYDEIIVNQIKHTNLQIASSINSKDIKKARLTEKYTCLGIGETKLSERRGNSSTNNAILNIVVHAQGKRDDRLIDVTPTHDKQ
jgi:predicted transcriptional regulator